MTRDPTAFLQAPVWFGPLLSPSWLLPAVREDATRVLFCADAWDDGSVDAAGRDLRLGLPLYLAEAARFGTDSRPVVLRGPAGPADVLPEADVTMRSAVAPGGASVVQLRALDPGGGILAEIVRDVHDVATLGSALESLPPVLSDAAASGGVRPIWNSLYALPTGAALVSYVRGQSASLRLTEAIVPQTTDAVSVAARRDDVRSILGALGSLATSTPAVFPALLFFGALLTAHDAGSPVVGEFRLPASARCTSATDPFDPVYAMTALVMRVFGDRDTSDRRMDKLRRTIDDPAVHRWLARVLAVT